VELHGADADVQLRAYLGIRPSAGDREENFFFAFGEGLDGLHGYDGGGAREAGEEPGGDTRVDERVTVNRGMDGLHGEVPGAGFEIDQAFLVLTTIYVVIPSLMVVLSLLAPARVNRMANIVVSLAYASSVVLSAVGETWLYDVLGSVVEVILLLAIARVAWTWPRRSAGVETTTAVPPRVTSHS
jgi:Family of unknown function (DUF6326)